MTATGGPTVVVDHVTVRYGSVVALDDVSLELSAGSVYGLVGMNGSGKSTLFKTILGMIVPQSGSVRLDGRTPAKARAAGLVGYVPQTEEIDFDFPLSVRDLVMMGRYGRLGVSRRPRRADREAVARALERVELTELAHRSIRQLSGGQRKRAFVARAIAQEPEVLLLDEPFAGVDKRTEAAISSVLREFAAAGALVLVSTHDLHTLPKLADEALLLLRRVLAQGDPADVISPENLVRAFGLDPLERGAVS